MHSRNRAAAAIAAAAGFRRARLRPTYRQIPAELLLSGWTDRFSRSHANAYRNDLSFWK